MPRKSAQKRQMLAVFLFFPAQSFKSTAASQKRTHKRRIMAVENRIFNIFLPHRRGRFHCAARSLKARMMRPVSGAELRSRQACSSSARSCPPGSASSRPIIRLNAGADIRHALAASLSVHPHSKCRRTARFTSTSSPSNASPAPDERPSIRDHLSPSGANFMPRTTAARNAAFFLVAPWRVYTYHRASCRICSVRAAVPPWHWATRYKYPAFRRNISVSASAEYAFVAIPPFVFSVLIIAYFC